MYRSFLVIITSIILIGCSVNDMYIGSQKTDDYSYSKQKNFIVTLPSNPTDIEVKLFSTIVSELKNNHFRLVDSLQEADVVMIFYCRDSMDIEYVHKTRDFRNMGYTEMDRDTKTHSLIVVRAYDAKKLIQGSRELIWQANISTDPENIKKDPGKAIDYLLNLYGKNKVSTGLFRPRK